MAPEVVTLERSPVDALRVVTAGVLLAMVGAIAYLFGTSVLVFASGLFEGVSVLPLWFIEGLAGFTHLAVVASIGTGVVTLTINRQWRALVVATASAAVAWGCFLALDLELTIEGGSLILPDNTVNEVVSTAYPTTGGLAALAAIATAVAPWLPRRGRRTAWAILVLASLCRFLTTPISFDVPAALLVGWLVGSLALLIAKSPARRPSADAVADALRGIAVPLASLEEAAVDARGSTPYFGRREDGTRLFVKVLGADERSADLLFRIIRQVQPRNLGDERPFSSLRRAVEHEALVAYAARSIGVPTPPVVGFAFVEPNGFVLAYEAIDGRSLDGVDPERITDEVLDAVWNRVVVLRKHRIAHRDLRLANVFLGDDGTVSMIDFGFSELAASDLLLANDLAELLASLATVVGPERSAAAGAKAVGAELATALPRLKPFALSGASRSAIKDNPQLLRELRTLVSS